MEDMEDLGEKFPGDFLQYVQNKCTQEEWFPYALFEGEEDADYDTWLSCFYEMRSAWQEGNTEKAESLYEDLGKQESAILTRPRSMPLYWCRRIKRKRHAG